MKESEKYTDELDRASALEAAAVEIQIKQASIKAKTLEFSPTGFCLNCAEKLNEGLRFCDKDCADDFQRRVGK